MQNKTFELLTKQLREYGFRPNVGEILPLLKGQTAHFKSPFSMADNLVLPTWKIVYAEQGGYHLDSLHVLVEQLPAIPDRSVDGINLQLLDGQMAAIDWKNEKVYGNIDNPRSTLFQIMVQLDMLNFSVPEGKHWRDALSYKYLYGTPYADQLVKDMDLLKAKYCREVMLETKEGIKLSPENIYHLLNGRYVNDNPSLSGVLSDVWYKIDQRHKTTDGSYRVEKAGKKPDFSFDTAFKNASVLFASSGERSQVIDRLKSGEMTTLEFRFKKQQMEGAFYINPESGILELDPRETFRRAFVTGEIETTIRSERENIQVGRDTSLDDIWQMITQRGREGGLDKGDDQRKGQGR